MLLLAIHHINCFVTMFYHKVFCCKYCLWYILNWPFIIHESMIYKKKNITKIQFVGNWINCVHHNVNSIQLHVLFYEFQLHNSFQKYYRYVLFFLLLPINFSNFAKLGIKSLSTKQHNIFLFHFSQWLFMVIFFCLVNK